jgi:hypothetical protein
MHKCCPRSYKNEDDTKMMSAIVSFRRLKTPTLMAEMKSKIDLQRIASLLLQIRSTTLDGPNAPGVLAK